METIRAFIAFRVGADVLAKLAETQRRIGSNLPFLKPVRPRGIHLTLIFLGEIAESQVNAVGAAMKEVCAGHGRMELFCGRVGAFPDLRNPRVIWAGLDGDLEKLGALQKELAAKLEGLGFPMEKRPFKPHLTLFRIKTPKQLGALRKKMEQVSEERFGPVPCHTLILYKSDLKPDGAVYTPLKMVGLE